jgi:hypothetical protein
MLAAKRSAPISRAESDQAETVDNRRKLPHSAADKNIE